MSLLKSNSNANADAKPSFEDDTSTATATQASTERAVATKKPNAVGAVAKVDLTVMESFKDALTVEYNTLAQIIATSGNFVAREDKTNMGDSVIFGLLSFQDSYVVSPEDDDAPDDVVRYSSDGVTCSDGTNVEDHLQFLRTNGFPKAKLKQRVVVVAAIESAAKTSAFNGELMQFDLSPSSRVMWNRFMANVAYGLSIGKYTTEQVKRVKAETLLQTKGNDTFTVVKFSVAE